MFLEDFLTSVIWETLLWCSAVLVSIKVYLHNNTTWSKKLALKHQWLVEELPLLNIILILSPTSHSTNYGGKHDHTVSYIRASEHRGSLTNAWLMSVYGSGWWLRHDREPALIHLQLTSTGRVLIYRYKSVKSFKRTDLVVIWLRTVTTYVHPRHIGSVPIIKTQIRKLILWGYISISTITALAKADDIPIWKPFAPIGFGARLQQGVGALTNKIKVHTSEPQSETTVTQQRAKCGWIASSCGESRAIIHKKDPCETE